MWSCLDDDDDGLQGYELERGKLCWMLLAGDGEM